MKFEVNKLRVDEIEINIENIIKQCIKRVGIIIACAVVFALLVPGLIYVKDMNAYNSGAEEPAEIELSDAEQAGIEKYQYLKSKVEQLRAYGENAMVLKLDYENVYQGRLQFYVDAEEDAQFDIAYVISNYINSGAVAKEVCALRTLESTTYISELFGAEVSGISSGVTSGIVNFRVWASSEEECQSYIAITKEILDEFSRELNTTMAKHSLKLVEEKVIVGYSSEVDSKQSGYVERMNTAIANLDAHAETLTDLQKQVIEREDNPQENEPVTITAPSFSIKWVVVGFVLGAVAAVGVIVLYVVFGGRLQTEQELLRRFDISHFGSLKTKEDSKRIDIVSARLGSCLEKAGRKEIALIGTTKEIRTEGVIALTEELKARGIKCELLGNILTEKEAFEAMKEKDCVVFVETIGQSVVKEIYEESMVCIDAQVEVIGYISVIE